MVINSGCSLEYVMSSFIQFHLLSSLILFVGEEHQQRRGTPTKAGLRLGTPRFALVTISLLTSSFASNSVNYSFLGSLYAESPKREAPLRRRGDSFNFLSVILFHLVCAPLSSCLLVKNTNKGEGRERRVIDRSQLSEACSYFSRNNNAFRHRNVLCTNHLLFDMAQP